VASPSFSSSAPTSVAPMPTETPSTLRIEQPSLSLSERFGQDPIGNTLAILTLVGMLIALGVGVFLAFFSRAAPPAWLGWTIPVLAFLGLLVSGYLSYVEVTGTEAVCGPVGDCNAVQQSPYARLFGVVPIGVLGLVGYFFILGLWLVARVGRDRPVEVWATLLQMALTVLGVLFSIYLTFLEPFVIGATCAWCLTSAILNDVINAGCRLDRASDPPTQMGGPQGGKDAFCVRVYSQPVFVSFDSDICY
ncbi:MAG: vitamin K epoxide reductase family protein, partial [Anaerolineales bacterium]|nr:vitamin K epoxide reductase family protein [Anaerolineales bacterium]